MDRGAGLDDDAGDQQQQDAPQRRIWARLAPSGLIVHRRYPDEEFANDRALRIVSCGEYEKAGVGIPDGRGGRFIRAK